MEEDLTSSVEILDGVRVILERHPHCSFLRVSATLNIEARQVLPYVERIYREFEAELFWFLVEHGRTNDQSLESEADSQD